MTEREKQDHRDSILKVRVLLEAAEHTLMLAVQKAPGITIDGEPIADLAAMHKELRAALESIHVASIKTYFVYPAT